MLKTKFATLARIAPALALWSCAAPKATVVAPPPPKTDPAAVVPVPTEPLPVAQPDRGIRLPDMLAMPGDGEFRATTPNATKVGSEVGAVISRPPTDPPSRPKAKPAANE